MSGPAISAERLETVGKYRWTICALLFFATTINYIDRQLLGFLAPTLQAEIGFNEVQYGNLVSWFTAAYALGFLGAGRLMDKVGVKFGFAGGVVLWSLAAMSTALASTVGGFSVARFALGLGESTNFPASIKTVAEWFPPRERAFATGIFNGGTNIGAIVVPIITPFIVLKWGWRAAFIITGALGFIWLIFWFIYYERPERSKRVSKQELAFIQAGTDKSTTAVPWAMLLTHRQTWAFVLGKALTDPVWWFYLFWLPKFLAERYDVKLVGLAAPLIVIYLVADVASITGGWLSSPLMKRGWSLNRARKTALLVPAVLIIPAMWAPNAESMWGAVALITLACSMHQWWSANLFTLSSDLFPQRAVGSIVGMGGFAGAASGFIFQRITGHVLQNNGNNYTPIFLWCGLSYLVALIVIHLLVPKSEPARLPDAVVA